MLNLRLFNQALFNQPAATTPSLDGLAHRGTDIRWQTQTLDTNFVMVYGEAPDGSLVSGQAYDSGEVQKAGYRLDVLAEPALTTSALCQSVAQAIIEKSRLRKSSGELSALPNCGIELFDIVQITDRWNNLGGSKFRVTGVQLSYCRERGTIKQTLELGAV